MDYDGILLVDKPIGWSSFDVVAKVRGQLRHLTGVKKPKVGHTGTLDPLATGLLILVLGSYCKQAQNFSKLDKTYEVGMELGRTSTTGDKEGEIVEGNGRLVAEQELRTIFEQFTGEIQQVPPVYSAIKVNGQRAYKLARAGKEVVLESRAVTINSLTLTKYSYPYASFTTEVSTGTYIRSLVQDIGLALRTGAYMSELRRTTVGSFSINNAVAIDENLATVLQSAILKP